jgi:outer membrane protein assembly factor BamB
MQQLLILTYQELKSRHFFLWILSLIITPLVLSAQTWERSFYDGLSLQQPVFSCLAHGGGYIVSSFEKCGAITPCHQKLMKLSEGGGVEWVKEIGLPSAGGITLITPTNDGGYLTVVNSLEMNFGFYETLIKIDGFGEEIWRKNLSYVTPDKLIDINSLKEDLDGNIIACGSVYDYDSISYTYDVVYFKIDNLGNVLWKKTIDAEKQEWGQQIELVENDGYIFASQANKPYLNSSDPYLRVYRIDKEGNLLWEKIIQHPGVELNLYLGSLFYRNGSHYVVFSVSSNNSTDFTGILKLDDDGTELWRKVVNDTTCHNSYCSSIFPQVCAGIDGGEIVFIPKASSFFKFDEDGNQLWQHLFEADSIHTNLCYSMLASTEGYFISGRDLPYQGIYAVKLDKEAQISNLKTPRIRPAPKLFPNPFHDSFTLEGMEESDIELRFFDVLGRERLKLDAQNGVFDNVSLTNLPNGAYFIHLNQRGQGTAIIKAAKY